MGCFEASVLWAACGARDLRIVYRANRSPVFRRPRSVRAAVEREDHRSLVTSLDVATRYRQPESNRIAKDLVGGASP